MGPLLLCLIVKNSVLITGRHKETNQADRGGIERGAKTGSDFMMTPMTRGGKVGGSQRSCGCGGFFKPLGRQIWLPGKSGRVTEREAAQR